MTVALREADHRKAICCLLAVEIADYEAKPVLDQVRLAQQFHHLLHESKVDASSDECVSVVGEGSALLGFFADAQECFATALRIREATLSQYRDLSLRIGVNLGQAEIATDEFGNPQVSGAARRDTDRLMRLSPPCQISVSRQFFEVLARAAPELAHLLEYRGLHPDPTGPPLGLYRISAAQTESGGRSSDPSSSAGDGRRTLSATTPPQPMAKQGSGLSRLWLGCVVLLSVGCVLLSLLAVATLVSLIARPSARAPSASLTISTPQTLTPTPVALPPPAVAREAMDPGVAKPTTPPSKRNTRRPMERSEPSPAEDITQVAQATPLAEQETALPSNGAGQLSQPEPSVQAAEPAPPHETSPVQPARSGMVLLAVKPWGEVFIDGRQIGITPPLKVFDLPIGRHTLTITNSSLPIYQQELDVEPETILKVVHDFACEPTRDKICRAGLGKAREVRSLPGSETADTASRQ